jgi:GH24 family phage-related lysozyme (muramidase)
VPPAGVVLILMAMATYLEQSLAQLEIFEGCIPWMYLDTVGKVTVGVGFMLPDSAAAAALPFQLAGQASTANEITDDFGRVTGMAAGHVAGFYQQSDSLQLPQSVIDARLLHTLQGFEGLLRAAMTGYDGLPPTVKMALLDMAYNLGPVGLLKGYPHMLAAVSQGDWATAAANCSRSGPSPARNAWTKQQFLNALSPESSS